MLVYGMGEKAIVEIAKSISEIAENWSDKSNISEFPSLSNIPQTAYISCDTTSQDNCLILPSHEECLKNKVKFAEAFKQFEEESNKIIQRRIVQSFNNSTKKGIIIINPPYPTPSTEDADKIYDLPYTRLPHPKYAKRGIISAYEMIKHSVNIHRGCFGGCAFCAINAHQGKQIISRSEKSILKEIEDICNMDNFKGYISDVGGPSANMYKMRGKNLSICEKCSKASCIFPNVCNNLNIDHSTLLSLYRKIEKNHNIKKFFVTSGIRYDLFDDKSPTPDKEYAEYLIKNCVSGRLKVAPEHCDKAILDLVRKPSFDRFEKFKIFFDNTNRKYSLNQQLIPYFISSLPGCGKEEMCLLQQKLKQMNYKVEQVQDFTPTPMTLSTTIYYTGINPYTGKKIFTEKNLENKRKQFNYFSK
jgi:uncharacterized radical SAM protein YgiQ